MNVIRYAKIGVFFLVIAATGTWYVIMAADGFSAWNTKVYEVVLDDATGLNNNSKVFMAGVPVGKIRAINLEEGRARLQVAFLKDVEIRGDSRISRQASSLLGTSVLALSPGTPETPILPAGGRLASVPAGGDFRVALSAANELSGQISAILTEFQTRHLEMLAASLKTINALGSEIDRRSKTELDRVSRILESTANIAERLEAVISSRESDVDASVLEVRAALENIRAITEGLRKGEGDVGRALTDDALYEKILEVAEQTESAAANLDEALKSVTRLATNADKVVVDAGDIVSKANGLGVQVDVRSGYDILSARVVSGAALRLEPRGGDRWYRVGVSGAPDGVTSRTQTTETSGGTTTVTDTTETSFGYSFDAELARIFGPLTVRAGLLESTAGFGLDFRFIPQLELTGEVFDFRTGAPPNLRGYLTYYPFFNARGNNPLEWLYLRGGVRAALDDRRDFFLGGGFRFADEEARGLIGLVPLTGR